MYIVIWKRMSQRNWKCDPTLYTERSKADARADEIGRKPRHLVAVRYVEFP